MEMITILVLRTLIGPSVSVPHLPDAYLACNPNIPYPISHMSLSAAKKFLLFL